MTTVYVLTEGEYSDYHIVALFSSREKAEEARALCPDSEVEEYELDALEIPEYPKGCVGWTICINANDNTINRAFQCEALCNNFNPEEIYLDGGRHPSAFPIFMVKCWARDKEHAEKIALDKFYQWKWEREQI